MKFTQTDVSTLDKALRLLRDRHYNYYYTAHNRDSESAQNNLATYNRIEELRKRVTMERREQIMAVLNSMEEAV